MEPFHFSIGLLLRESDGRRLSPGPRLTRFALDVLLNATARAPRHPILKSLAQTVGETVNLTMLDGSKVVYLDRIETACIAVSLSADVP